MDALEYFKTKDRMTSKCCINCKDCKLSPDNNGKDISCYGFESEYTEQAIKIVEDWSKENPAMTNKDKYLEVMKETFGVKDEEINTCKYYCKDKKIPRVFCNQFDGCNSCDVFWNTEYKPVKEEE